MSDAVDLYVVYAFLKKITTPFDKWEAYKNGAIDASGNQLVLKADMSSQQRASFTYLDLMVCNMKRLLEKLPGGKSTVGTYAAALLLLKQYVNVQKESEDLIRNLPSLMENYIEEAAVRVTEDTVAVNSVGSGAIAGTSTGAQGEPGFTPRMMKKYKQSNQKEASKKVNKIDVSRLGRILNGNMKK